MIDIDNQIYTLVRNELVSNGYTNISRIYRTVESEFPYIYFQLLNNSVNTAGSDSGDIEKFADVSYQIDIFTQGETQITTASEIAQIIDTVFNGLGFKRTYGAPTPNHLDLTISRFTLRYSATVDKNKKIYGGT